MTKFISLACVMALMTVVLTGCGRKGSPQAPPGSTYPATYPNQ